MSARSPQCAVASWPADAESWIKAPDVQPARRAADGGFTTRVNIDITPEQRGRIEVVAFRRGVTVADKLRDLLAREFPADPGDPL
jgi:hypothetical protein